MVNSTLVEEEVLKQIKKIAREKGIAAGHELKKGIESGQIDPNKMTILKVPVGNFIPEQNLPKSALYFMKLGLPIKPETAEGVNIGVLGASIYTGTSALVGYQQTTNGCAKVFYSLSTALSGSAITTGGIAVVARSCNISRPAVLSEVFAAMFLYMGNQAHVSALMIENKPIPARLQSSLYISKETRQALAKNYANGLSFVMPGGASGIALSGVIESIPFEIIGKYVGVGLSVYGYSRLVIVSYRYGQQFFDKYKSRRRSRVYRKQIQFFVVGLTLSIDSSTYYKFSP